MNIHKEHFEAWLFSQPREREFHYLDTKRCMICAFIRETSAKTDFWVGGTMISMEGIEFDIPGWLRQVLKGRKTSLGVTDVFSIGHIQDEWRKLWPESEPATTNPEPKAIHDPAHSTSAHPVV